VYGAVPGELAPKLALAHACELQGALGNAVRLYEVCARTDAAYVAPGCFGMARVEAGEGNLSSALDALDRIPTTSRAYVEARRMRIELQLGAAPDPDTLAQVADEVNRLGLDPRDLSEVRTRVYGAALAAAEQDGAAQGRGRLVGGVPVEPRALRLAIEHELRQQAKLTDDRRERVRLVDDANAVRPRTLV
jgi:serine/threonine-protein kinase PknG